MLQGPQPAKRTRKKSPATRVRAQTDYKQQQRQQQPPAQAPAPAAQDDLLDLFGGSITNANPTANSTANSNSNGNENPFGDPFADFGFAENNTNSSASSPPQAQAQPDDDDDDKNDEKAPKSKKKKKSSKKKKTTRRAHTVASKAETPNVNYGKFANHSNGNANTNANGSNQMNGAAPSKKMKKIDVLPLLHQGIRANKFKLNGNKSKVRTFYLTDTNFYFCWEAVGQQNEKKGGGLFGKKGAQTARSKVDKDRSIPIRAIRSLQKNPAYMMQSYNFIPPQQKSLTLTIVYSVDGQEKKLNFMAYEAFHHQLLYEGMQQLITAARDPKRNLAEVFELYVDFQKEILPKHLRPQRFKWEPLGDSDFGAANNNNNNNNAVSNNLENNNNDDQLDNANGNNMYFDNTQQAFQDIDMYDPTADGQFGRSRIKSFWADCCW